MSTSQENFKIAKSEFLKKEELREGNEVIKKITTLVNDLAKNFNGLNGSELSELQVKLSGYKFYLADFIADLMNKAKYLEAWIKEEKSMKHDEFLAIIKDTDPTLRNKDEIKKKIENLFLIQLSPEINEQIFYESEWQRYKMKNFSIDAILTSIVQRLAELKRQQEQSKHT